MKTKKIFVAVIPLLLTMILACGEVRQTTVNYDESHNTFSDLDIYGQWINVPPLGDVWKPNVGYDWRPYDAGQWELTDRGWMWFSDEPYGWIVYHYGYWAFTAGAGWVWIPGYDWSPARVRWVMQDDYVGWAPLPPSGWNLPEIYENNGDRVWVVVHTRDFDNREINRYRVAVNTVNTRRDWNSNHTPDPQTIRTATGRNITPVNTQTENVRGGRRDLTRVRIVDQNRPATTPSQPGNNNQNTFTPPPVSRTQPQQPTTPNNNRTNTGDRNVGNPTRNVQPPQTRGDLVEPKRPDDKPAIRPVAPERNSNEQKVETRPKPQQQPVIRNDNAVRTKANTPVVPPDKKPLKVNDMKKQKQEGRQLDKKNVKKPVPKEKEKSAAKDDKAK